MKLINNVVYIADINLPSFRAHAIHVLKMVDNLCEVSRNVKLIVNFKDKGLNLKKIKKIFYLHNNIKNFQIDSVNLFKKKNDFFSRVKFGYNSSKILKNFGGLIITRSFYVSFFLYFYNKKHILEIHQELSGLTNFFFRILQLFGYSNFTKIIFITKSLSDYYKKFDLNYKILPDAVDLRDFKYKKKLNSKISRVFYVGSFYKGRGIELILDIAKLLPKKKFILYGKRDEKMNENFLPKNVKIYNYVPFYKIPKILRKADLLLMPYSLSGVSINSNKIDTSKYASPMKMFEYLASGVPLISSNLKVLKEILKDKNNCLIAKDNDPKTWVENIMKLENKTKLKKKISSNGLKTASTNTWLKRVVKIIKWDKRNTI